MDVLTQPIPKRLHWQICHKKLTEFLVKMLLTDTANDRGNK